jgi:hypothetical protein
VNVLLYLERACPLVERLRHFGKCLRPPPRVRIALSVCAWPNIDHYHPAASSSPGTSRWKYIVHGGCSIASVPHVPNTPTVELLGQPYQLLVHWRYAKADQGHVCCTEQQRWLWSTTRTRKSRMRTTKETSRRAALLMALQQRSAGSQTRLPACLLCHSLSAIYTRPLYAQAHKTIHRCTVVGNG